MKLFNICSLLKMSNFYSICVVQISILISSTRSPCTSISYREFEFHVKLYVFRYADSKFFVLQPQNCSNFDIHIWLLFCQKSASCRFCQYRSEENHLFRQLTSSYSMHLWCTVSIKNFSNQSEEKWRKLSLRF